MYESLFEKHTKNKYDYSEKLINEILVTLKYEKCIQTYNTQHITPNAHTNTYNLPK